MNDSGKRFYQKGKFWISLIVILILISLLVSIIRIITSDSRQALWKFKSFHGVNGPSISYTFNDHSNLYQTVDSGTVDSGDVLKQEEQDAVLSLVSSIKIPSTVYTWDSVDPKVGSVFVTFTLTYPNGYTMLFESNLVQSRYTLTTPDGTVFKEFCDFDTKGLAVFAIEHYIN